MSEGLAAVGSKSILNITASTVISSVTAQSYSGRRVAKLTVLVAGTVAGGVHDTATVASAALSNQLFVIPIVLGVYLIDFPYFSGLVVVPGTGQTVAIAYD